MTFNQQLLNLFSLESMRRDNETSLHCSWHNALWLTARHSGKKNPYAPYACSAAIITTSMLADSSTWQPSFEVAHAIPSK